MNRAGRFAVAIIIIFLIVAAGFLVQENRQEVKGYEQVDFLIGVSHANLIEEWQIALHDEMDNYSARYDHVKLIYTNGGSSSFKQISDVNKLMEYGIDLLIITVNDAAVLGSVVEEINEIIPVIVLDEDVIDNDYTLLIGPEYYNVGVLAGNRMIELSAGKEFKVAVVNGPIEDRVVTTVHSGFIDTLDKSQEVEVVGNIYSDWLSGETKNEFRLFMEESDEIDAVFVQSNELAVEIIEVMNEMEMNIPIITASKYLSDRYLTYIDLEELDSILYTPVGGKEAVDYAIEILNNPNDRNAVPKRIMMKSNMVSNENKDFYRYHKTQEYQHRIGYIETNLYSEGNMESFFNEYGEMLFYEIDEFLDSADKDILQKKYFESLLMEEVDIIILRPESSSGWQPMIDKAKEQGISIICIGNTPYINSELMDSNVFYIGPDFLDQGKKLATYLIQEVYSTSYDIGIFEITDDVDMQLTYEKTKSLNAQISGYSRINIIDSIEIDTADSENIQRQYQKLEESLNKYQGDINVIYLHDAMNVSRIEEILENQHLANVIIISSNDSGVVQNNSTIDYQVSPTILYKEQLRLIVDSYYAENQLKMEKIYLPNNETY